MITQLKSEFRKLLTVRSTYILIGIAFALLALFAYTGTSAQTYEEAVCKQTGEVLYSQNQTDPRLADASPEQVCGGTVVYTQQKSSDLPKEKLLYNLQETLPIMTTFVSIVLILFVAHEFRYNTINYTLTISNSRSKVLLAKLIVGSIVIVVTTLVAIAIATAMTYAAISIKDLTLPAQDYNWLYILSRHLGYALGYGLFCLGLALLIRNLTASIAIAFVLPTVDGLAGYLLATRDIEPTKALPFSALDRFGNVVLTDTGTTFANEAARQPATVLIAAGVFSIYLVVLWAAAWLLFLRRDAN